MRLDVRSVRALVLVAWAALFTWLWVSGESVRYLGPRTQWVIPVGAIGLALAGAGYLLSTSHREYPRIGRREGLGLAALLVPVLAALVLANAQLGALAASNKLSSRGIDSAALARLASRDAKQVGFLQLNAAGHDAQLSRELGLVAGRPIELTGFVSEAGRSFTLSRFYITCCVADAVPVGVRVVAAGPRPEVRRDAWLNVTGVLVRGDREWNVRALRIERIKPPADPYLSFVG
jgi:putative membrane protein